MTTQERNKFNYSVFSRERFNTKKANSIVIETLHNTKYSPKQHEDLYAECKFNICKEFGWTKGFCNYINNKLMRCMLDSGLIFKYRGF